MQVFALGSNGSGQLGLGHEEDAWKPTAVEIPIPPSMKSDTIKDIVAGGNHTLILMHSGDVYATGANEDGRCGSRQERLLSFERVSTSLSEIGRVALCAATWQASILVTGNRKFVLTRGTGFKGELGLGPDKQQAPIDLEIADVHACMGHAVAVFSNGEVHGWGSGKQGQLGEPLEDVWRPRKIKEVPFKALRAVCGKDFTAVFGDPKEGKIMILGPKRDRFGIKANAPKSVPGWKDLLAWGRNDHGQLPPPGLPTLQCIRAGSEHMLAMTSSEKVLVWGWGEHGNCGLPVDDRSDVKERWNELVVQGTVKSLGAGCATSWIVAD
ncbi:alpha tubulin suppressor [Taxawa tesnikishii (nom. ined.)]|nr:alpha tubulin suppressor [Dothideales sp. JES 119]